MANQSINQFISNFLFFLGWCLFFFLFIKFLSFFFFILFLCWGGGGGAGPPAPRPRYTSLFWDLARSSINCGEYQRMTPCKIWAGSGQNRPWILWKTGFFRFLGGICKSIQLEQNRLEVQKILLHMKFSQCNCLQKCTSSSTWLDNSFPS